MKLVALGTLLIFFCVLMFRFTRITPSQSTSLTKTQPPILIKTDPLEHMDHVTLADTLSLEAGIHPALIRSMIRVESNWNPNAISIAGAVGLLQVMPANFSDCNLKSPSDLLHPVKNLRCGIRLIKQRLTLYKNRVIALRRYNASKRCQQGQCPSVEKYVRDVLAEFPKGTSILIDEYV